MSFLTKMHRWESKLKKQPKEKLVRLVSLLFVVSLVTGYGVSIQMRIRQQQEIKKTEQQLIDIQHAGMQERIETLKESRYARK